MLSRYILLLTLIFSCTPPIDYFGNNIDLFEENIYLSDLRDDSKDRFTLVFKGHFNAITQNDMIKREKTLERYIKLIKKYYGYTESEIVDEEIFGVISPRYYVTIQFN